MKNHANIELTVIAPFSVVDRILPKSELLQIGISFCQQSYNEHCRPSGIQSCHGFGCGGITVFRGIDYYNWETDNVNPDSLKVANV